MAALLLFYFRPGQQCAVLFVTGIRFAISQVSKSGDGLSGWLINKTTGELINDVFYCSELYLPNGPLCCDFVEHPANNKSKAFCELYVAIYFPYAVVFISIYTALGGV